MKLKRAGGIAASILLILILIIGILYWSSRESHELLSQDEIITLIEQKYEGTIEQIARSEQQSFPSFDVTLTNAQGTYAIIVNAEHGNIEKMTRMTAAKPTDPSGNMPEPAPSKDNDQQTAPSPGASNGSDKEPAPPSKPDSSSQGGSSSNQGESTAPITKQKAKEIALKQVKGTITSVELEDDDDLLAYEIELNTADHKEVKIYINAYTGEVISLEWDED